MVCDYDIMGNEYFKIPEDTLMPYVYNLEKAFNDDYFCTYYFMIFKKRTQKVLKIENIQNDGSKLFN